MLNQGQFKQLLKQKTNDLTIIVPRVTLLMLLYNIA